MIDKQYSLGVDIGGTNTVFGLIDRDGHIIKKDSILTNSKRPPQLLFEKIFSIIICCKTCLFSHSCL